MARHRTAALAAAFLSLPLGLTTALAGPAAAYAGTTPPACGTGFRIGFAAGMPNYHGRSGVSLGSEEYFSDQFPDAVKNVPGFGSAISVADANDDGCNDLVVGQPGTSKTKGYASILWGSSTGLDDSGLTLITGPHVGDAFGTSIATATRGDGSQITDVWIGAPDRTVDGKTGAGAVDHYTVDKSGTPTLVGTLTAASNGSGGTVHAGAHFGQVVQAYAGTVTIGAPDDTVSGKAGAGSITMTRLNADTGKVTTAKYWTQNSSGVPGTAETGDHFGASLYADGLVTIVGVPDEDVGSLKDAGSVQMFYAGKPTQSITQNTPGVPGTAEAGDHFGASVAVGTWFLTQGGGDVAIGSPGEDVGSVKDAGSVTLLTLLGPTLGTIDASKTLTQGTGGLGGKIEAGDQVGAALAAIRGDNSEEEDTADTLVVGVPGEDISGATNCGLVTEYAHTGMTFDYEAERTPGNRFGSVLASTLSYGT